MQHILVFAIAIPGTLSTGIRRLIDPGPPDPISDHPFAAAILSCTTSSSGTLACGTFCSGSLIAPDVVLTAGHCVNDAESEYNNPQPPVALKNMYVLLGSASPRKIVTNQQLIKVQSFVNKGYGLNKRFDVDDDMGLLFLSECATLVDGLVETVKIATLDDEPVSTNDGACVICETIGYGRITNLPTQIAYTDGMLRSIPDVVHTFDVCIKSYIGDTLSLDGYDLSYLDKPGNEKTKNFFFNFLVPEMHSCSGGNSVHSSCNGDSGGPIVAASSRSGGLVQIGLTSFGVNDYCGYGADYLTRVAPLAEFISEQISDKSKRCNFWDPSKSFATFPPPPLVHSDAYIASRCASGQWQCRDGTCIALSDVCNKSGECPDGSDEESSFCSYAYKYNGGGSSSMVRNYDNEIASQKQLETQSELDQLIEAYDQLIHGRRLGQEEGDIVAVVVGTITSVGRARPRIPDDVRESFPATVSTTTPEMKTPNIQVRSTDATAVDCQSIVSDTNDLIKSEQANGFNRVEKDPSPITAACGSYNTCISSNLISDSSTLSSFCSSFESFVSKRSQALQSVSRFDSRYGNTCAAPNFEYATISNRTISGDPSLTGMTTDSPTLKTNGSATMGYTLCILIASILALIHI